MTGSYQFSSLLLFLLSPFFLFAQSAWELKKDEDGIQVYTRSVSGSSFKAFRGVTELDYSLEEVVGALIDIGTYQSWMPDTKKVKILDQQSESFIVYYVATEVPWPVSDRDGVYQMKTSYNPDAAQAIISVKALPEYVEEYKNHVRVRKSDTIWKIKELAENRVSIDYSVAAEPGGSIPAWLVKMKLVSIPFETLDALKSQVAKGTYKGKSFDFMQN